MSAVNVMLWGQRVGAAIWDNRRQVAVFQYAPDFVATGLQLAPLTMPLGDEPYLFPQLNRDTYRGLPGLLADSLPDHFGNRLIDVWLAERGSPREAFSPVDRLCYIGRRGMGALEFEPAMEQGLEAAPLQVDVGELSGLANRVLDERAALSGRLGTESGKQDLEKILRVGVSPGGARAKAVLAWNPATGEFRSGQVEADDGFEHWLLKFDGVTGTVAESDDGLGRPQGYGKIEYAYHLMARAAGIAMSECRLHQEGGRSHFMTRRFDRGAGGTRGGKLHMQTLWALQHCDYSVPPAHSYEQAVYAIKALGLGMPAVEEQFRRAVFNVMARNQDDHVKNLAFLMDASGSWSLSPAYDISYAWNPAAGAWTRVHQLSLAGKRDGFAAADLRQFAKNIGLKTRRAETCIEQVAAALAEWPSFAGRAGVPPETAAAIKKAMRLDLVG